MIKDRTRQNIYIENKVYMELNEAMEKDDTQSVSEFTNRALKFYIGFLNTKRAENYLIGTFGAAIKGTVDGTERRLSGFLRTVLIEMTVIRSMIAALKPNEMQDWQMRELYAAAEKQVDDKINAFWDKE